MHFALTWGLFCLVLLENKTLSCRQRKAFFVWKRHLNPFQSHVSVIDAFSGISFASLINLAKQTSDNGEAICPGRHKRQVKYLRRGRKWDLSSGYGLRAVSIMWWRQRLQSWPAKWSNFSGVPGDKAGRCCRARSFAWLTAFITFKLNRSRGLCSLDASAFN